MFLNHRTAGATGDAEANPTVPGLTSEMESIGWLWTWSSGVSQPLKRGIDILGLRRY